MDDRDPASGTFSGLTPEEAKEFHSLFVQSFAIFTLVALGAHVLVWLWRPWFPGVNGYSELPHAAHAAQAAFSALVG